MRTKSPGWSLSPRNAAASSLDRKSTRLNSSHRTISYAVFCLKKKTNTNKEVIRPHTASDHARLRSVFRAVSQRRNPPQATALPHALVLSDTQRPDQQDTRSHC